MKQAIEIAENVLIEANDRGVRLNKSELTAAVFTAYEYKLCNDKRYNETLSPLFSDKIEVTDYGVRIEAIEERFGKYGENDIPIDGLVSHELTKDEFYAVDDMLDSLNAYKEYDPGYLVRLDKCWQSAHERGLGYTLDDTEIAEDMYEDVYGGDWTDEEWESVGRPISIEEEERLEAENEAGVYDE